MPRMVILILPAFLTTLLAVQLSGAEPPEPSDREIAAAVRGLGDDQFRAREEATDFLWRAGPVAYSAIEAAAQSEDLEVVSRAETLLENIRLGILPKDRPEFLSLVAGYANASLPQKGTILEKLQGDNRWKTMDALLSRGGEEQRSMLTREIGARARLSARRALMENKLAGLEESLEAAAMLGDDPLTERDWIALLLLSGRLDDAILRHRAAGTYQYSRRAAIRLAKLLRVRGDLREARTMAETTNDQTLLADLGFRLQDWSSLTLPERIPGDEEVEVLGFTATLHRLAGNMAQFDGALQSLQALVAVHPEKKWDYAEVLMVNGRWDEARILFSTFHREGGFQLLQRQLKFTESYHFLGLENPGRNAADWFVNWTKRLDPNSQAATILCCVSGHVAGTLHALGEVEAADRLLSEIEQFIEKDRGRRCTDLFKVESSLGLRDRAMKQAAKLLTNDEHVFFVLGVLFKDNPVNVRTLWEFLRNEAPAEDRVATIEKLRELLDLEKLPRPGMNLEEFTKRAEQAASTLKPNEGMYLLGALAELCILRKESNRARQYFEKQLVASRAVKVVEGSTPHEAGCLQRIAAMDADEGHWENAAENYARAWRLDRRNAAPLYFEGYALERLGRKTEGKSLMQQAVMLPLGDSVMRR